MNQISSDAKGIWGERHVEIIVKRMGCAWHGWDSKAYGLDGLIELKKKQPYHRSLFIGVQVKTGRSYIRKENKRELLATVNPEHVEYWHALSFPVIFVWFDERRRKTYWTRVNTKSAPPGSSQIQLPKSSKFGIHVLGDLRRLAMTFFGPFYYLPVIEAPVHPSFRVSRKTRDEAWGFYKKWRSEGCISLAFGEVLISLRGWRHVTASWRAQRAIVHRLQLLPVARKMLEELPLCHLRREVDQQSSKRRWKCKFYEQSAVVRYPYRRDAVVSVVTEQLADGPVRFYSVYEHPIREETMEDVVRARQERLLKDKLKVIDLGDLPEGLKQLFNIIQNSKKRRGMILGDYWRPSAM